MDNTKELEVAVREWVIATKEMIDAQYAKARAFRDEAPLDKRIACSIAESMSLTRLGAAELQLVQLSGVIE